MSSRENAPAGPAGANGVVKKKRVVTTAADRERARLKAEDIRWRAAKTPEAKAWINSTRLLKEAFSVNREDVLALKVSASARRDLWAKGDAMGLHVEIFDTQSRKDGPLESWIVIGHSIHKVLVSDKVKEIQRQNKRAIQQAEDEAEDDDDETEVDAGAAQPVNPAEMIDPSLREQGAPVAQMMLPPVQQAASRSEDIPQQLPAIAANDTQTDLPDEDIEAAKQLRDLKSQGIARPTFRQESNKPETTGAAEPAPAIDASPDRIANWVTQQAQSVQQEKDILDPSGTWNITCPAMTEQLNSTTSDLSLTIHLSKTQPHLDNDEDDDPTTPFTAPDNIPEDQLTPSQKARLGTYQLWATFELGLYRGLIRFMPPTTPNTSSTTRSSFDLQPSQLPSLANRTFQYKWRGRETSDAEISVEAQNATQWIKFGEDGVGLSGVFESEYLGETGFEGNKVGNGDAARVQLGKAWSQLSPRAHEAEARSKE